MPRFLLLISVAIGLTGCVTTPTKVVTEYESIRCPSISPPAIPPLPVRPDSNDVRKLEPDRYLIEGLWKGVQARQDAYAEAWRDCIPD